DTPTLLFDGIVKYDTDTGASTSYAFGPGRHGSEAPFAPRGGGWDVPGGGAGDEDDGYVIGFVHDEREDASEVLVLHAQDIAAGPVARVRIPQRVPLGFHACWVPGKAL